MKDIYISGFADEISSSFDEQLKTVRELGMQYISLRSADNMSVLTNEHPWIYIIAVFIVGAITTSQSSSTMIMVPIGIALGLPANIIVAGSAIFSGDVTENTIRFLNIINE